MSVCVLCSDSPSSWLSRRPAPPPGRRSSQIERISGIRTATGRKTARRSAPAPGRTRRSAPTGNTFPAAGDFFSSPPPVAIELPHRPVDFPLRVKSTPAPPPVSTAHFPVFAEPGDEASGSILKDWPVSRFPRSGDARGLLLRSKPWRRRRPPPAIARMCGQRDFGAAGYAGEAARRPLVFRAEERARSAGAGWPLR